MSIKLGEKIQRLRKDLGYTQKEFAEFLSIPQPSLSTYENDKNSPTTEVLINIATKCSVSLDWLCGLAENINKEFEITEMGDLVSVMYKLMEINEIGIEIKVNDKLSNDLESEESRWFTQLTIYGNDNQYKYNPELCEIISSIKNLQFDVDSFQLDAEMYEMKKQKDIAYYRLVPLTKKVVPQLTRKERMKKRVEYLNKNGLND